MYLSIWAVHRPWFREAQFNLFYAVVAQKKSASLPMMRPRSQNSPTAPLSSKRASSSRRPPTFNRIIPHRECESHRLDHFTAARLGVVTLCKRED